MLTLQELTGLGEPVFRSDHDLERSIDFLKMILFLSFIVSARLIKPSIFTWMLGNSFGASSSNNFNFEHPERYLPGLLFLLLFSVSSLAVYLSSIGMFGDSTSPVLVNMAVVIFFYAIILLMASFLQSVLFGIKRFLSSHFLDLITFFFLLGVGAFVLLLARWFLLESAFGIIQAVIGGFLLLTFGTRIVRLLLINASFFNQNRLLIFFYLCAAEIAPLLIIGKLLTNLV